MVEPFAVPLVAWAFAIETKLSLVEPFAVSLVAWAFAIETKLLPNHLCDGFVECAVEGFF